MKREKFNQIYNNLIMNLRNDLDSEHITKLKIFSSERIFDKYQKERSKIKKYYMKNPNENIDRHKIAACMLFAIMSIYPVYVPLKYRVKNFLKRDTFSIELSYINEYIAIYTALSILDNFFVQDKIDGILDEHRHRIYIPETFCDDYGYLLNMCIDLKFGKMKKKINILTYSNIFFLMEYQHPFNNDNKQEQEN